MTPAMPSLVPNPMMPTYPGNESLTQMLQTVISANGDNQNCKINLLIYYELKKKKGTSDHVSTTLHILSGDCFDM